MRTVGRWRSLFTIWAVTASTARRWLSSSRPSRASAFWSSASRISSARARSDAIVLAACGLDRLGLAREIGYRFEPEVMLPEAGQGALALQVRAGEEHLVAAADDPETRERVEAERAVVAAVGGGCLAPVAAHHDGSTLTGVVAAEDGSWIERVTGEDPEALGAELADASTRHS